jgi:hypothetical protein
MMYVRTAAPETRGWVGPPYLRPSHVVGVGESAEHDASGYQAGKATLFEVPGTALPTLSSPHLYAPTEQVHPTRGEITRPLCCWCYSYFSDSLLIEPFTNRDAGLSRAVARPISKAIGVATDKYEDRTDAPVLANLSVKIVHPGGRYLRIDYKVVDAAKFTKAFGESVKVHFVSARPKDMPGRLAQGALDGTVTCSVVMDDFPTVAKLVVSEPAPDISLALISRRGQQIHPLAWTAEKPVRIVVEHPRMVRKHLDNLADIFSKFEPRMTV